MKFIITTLLSVFLASGAIAQRNQLLTPEETEKEMLEVSRILYNDDVLDSIVTRALEHSNLIKAIDQEMKMFDEEILQKKRSWVSSFTFGVNVFSANTTLNTDNQSVTTYGVLPRVGLNLNVNPEKLINRKSYVRQTTNRKEYSRYIQEDTRMTLKKNILNLYYDYLGALESVNIRQHAYNTRKQQADYLNGLFTSGDVEYAQVLIAENQMHLAKEALVTTSIEAMKRRSEISVLTGLK